MAALEIAILAMFVFAVLYGTSRASGYFSGRLLARSAQQDDDLADPSPHSRVKTAKFGARFHRS
jgi:hypothetical protein